MTLRLATPRLQLAAATAETVRAELEDVRRFAALLAAEVPASWPPGEYDASAQRFFLEQLEANPAWSPWLGWYAVRPAEAARPATLIGAAGYFGPPSATGEVELGYSVCPEWRGRGYATELATALARHAAAQPGVARVLAHTTQDNPASIVVLERSGFTRAGPGREPGQLRFEYRPR